jgi:hypothetical protein
MNVSATSGIGVWGKVYKAASAAKDWIDGLADDLISDDTAETVGEFSSASPTAACGGSGTLDFPADVNITPDVVNIDGAHVEDGVIVFEGEYLIDDLGERVQTTGDIEVGPVMFQFSNASGRTVRVVIESVPEGVHPNLAGLDGMIDKTPIEYRDDAFDLCAPPTGGEDAGDAGSDAEVADVYEEADAYEADVPDAGDEDAGDAGDVGDAGEADGETACSYIKDPFNPDNRIPVFMGSWTLEDLRSVEPDAETEVCTADEIALSACSDRILASGADAYSLTIDPSLYNEDEGHFNLSFKLRIDASNYNPGHQYDYRIRIRLVIE